MPRALERPSKLVIGSILQSTKLGPESDPYPQRTGAFRARARATAKRPVEMDLGPPPEGVLHFAVTLGGALTELSPA